MPPYSYKITATHPTLADAMQIEETFSAMAWCVNDLKERGFNNIVCVRTDLSTGEQTNLLVV